MVTPFEKNLYVLKLKDTAHYEHVECIMLQEHQHVALLGVLGKHEDKRSGRTVGYCLFFKGAPYIHRYITYVGLAYSPPTETRQREGRVIYEDENVRLWRFGAGTFDYLLRSRKEPAFMKNDAGVILTGDGAAHSRFSGIWKEGI